MIVTIQSISSEATKTGAEYKKVTGVTPAGKQTTKSVFDNLKAQWPLLKENATLDFKMQKNGQYWNVIEITVPNLPPPQEANPAPDLPPPLPKEYMVEAAVKTGAKIIPDQNEIRNRSMAIAYSKDLAVAGKIELKQLKEYADKFLAYIKGEAL